jgi:hypothetical protein
MAALDISAALAAILILKPLRRRMAEGDARTAAVESGFSRTGAALAGPER